MNLRDTLKINSNGVLEVGGIDVCELKQRFCTPLYVLDYAYIKKVMQAFQSALSQHYGDGAVVYASKALSATAIYKIVNDLGLHADVVSKGEIFTALSGGLPAAKMVFHGNNKQEYELEYAVKNGVGLIAIDADDEPELLNEIAGRLGKVQDVLVRVNPGVEAHTHKHIVTAKDDSKFGFSCKSGAAEKVIQRITGLKNLRYKGLNCHIGSQIFNKDSFVLAADKMTDFMLKLDNEYGIKTHTLNLGGGFGVYYVQGDPKYTAEDYAKYVEHLAKNLIELLDKKSLQKPYLIIEPGRSLIGEAGITLYTLGAVKDVAGDKTYYAIDGGMFENPRFVMYGAKYSAVVADKANEPAVKKVTLTGKCCESGDMIAEDVCLQEAKRGNLIAVFTTGAYNYSMSSHYNSNLVPPIVMVKDGKADYIVRPETYEDLVRNMQIPEFV